MSDIKQTTNESAQSEAPTERRGIFQELAHRRVPQVLGLYLVGAWTFMEFFDSIIGRHNLSPHWIDISLLAIISMLPTVIILAYRHGAPGAQSWSKVEKVGIPANVIAMAALLMFNFADKDLGTRAEIIEGVAPDGSMLTVVRPNEEYRKRIYIGFFKLNATGIDDSMKLGLSHSLGVDLDQDPYTNTYNAVSSTRPLIEADFTDLSAPLTLMLKIARDNRMQYYLDGTLSNSTGGQLQLLVNVYDVADGKKLATITSSPQSNLFMTVDDVTPQIKKAIGLPDVIIDESPDLPIEEQLTSNLEAYAKYVSAIKELNLFNNFQAGEQLLTEAIDLDQSFAVALSDLAVNYLNQTRVNEGLEVLKKAEKHSYRLPVDRKFSLATFGNIFKGQLDSAKATLEQWLSLYPESIQAWSSKVNLHRILNQRELAIEAIDVLLRLEPYATYRYLDKGQFYVSMGKLDEAIEAFTLYAEKNPTNATAHILLGDTYRRQGNFEISNQQYQMAQALETNSLQSERRLLENMKREGKFQEAEIGYLQLIDEANSDITKLELSRELRSLYLETGRDLEALDWYDQSYELLKSIAPESNILMTKMYESWVYARAGQIARGQVLIDEAVDALQRFDNDLYRVNVMIGQTMFNVFHDSSVDPIPVIDEVQQRVAKFIGTGNDHTFQLMRGIAYHLTERHKEAIPLLTEYTAQFPNQDRNLWIALADSLLITDKVAEAMSIYQDLLIEYPAFPLAHFGLAKAHFKEGDYSSANAAIEVALNGWNSADEQYVEKQEALQLAAQIVANQQSAD